MVINDQGGYQCPACGYSTTAVRSTMSFEYFITRKRECLKCGHIHSTTEMRVELMAMLEHGHRITKSFEAMGGEASLHGISA